MQTTFQPQPKPEQTLLPTPTQAEITTLVIVTSPASSVADTQAIETLLAEHQRNAHIRKLCHRISCLILVPYEFYMLSTLLPGHKMSPIAPMVQFIFLPLVFILMPYLTKKLRLSELARTDQLIVVGSLINILNIKDVNSQQLAQAALTRLLPKLKASDAHLLNSEQRQVLNRALFTPDVPFTLAILKAWEQVGDSKAIPAVRALLNIEKKATRSTKMRERALTFLFGEKQTTGASVSLLPRSTKLLTAEQVVQIQDAALSCLRFLEQRAEQENANNTLLRAAALNSESTPDVLLRPAQAQADFTAPEMLLRSASDRE